MQTNGRQQPAWGADDGAPAAMQGLQHAPAAAAEARAGEAAGGHSTPLTLEHQQAHVVQRVQVVPLRQGRAAGRSQGGGAHMICAAGARRSWIHAAAAELPDLEPHSRRGNSSLGGLMCTHMSATKQRLTWM